MKNIYSYDPRQLTYVVLTWFSHIMQMTTISMVTETFKWSITDKFLSILSSKIPVILCYQLECGDIAFIENISAGWIFSDSLLSDLVMYFYFSVIIVFLSVTSSSLPSSWWPNESPIDLDMPPFLHGTIIVEVVIRPHRTMFLWYSKCNSYHLEFNICKSTWTANWKIEHFLSLSVSLIRGAWEKDWLWNWGYISRKKKKKPW